MRFVEALTIFRASALPIRLGVTLETKYIALHPSKSVARAVKRIALLDFR